MPNTLPLLPLVLDRTPESLRIALAQEGVATVERASAPRGGRFVLWDSKQGRLNSLLPGQIALDINEFRATQAEDPFVALADERAARAGWWVEGFDLSEEVSRVDKGTVRRRLMAALAARLQAEGGVWLRTSPYPFPYRTAFNFRLDHDDYVADDYDATLDAIRGHEAATTHFVCAADFVEQPQALARLRGMDVGSHGYRHHTFRDAEENRTNIARGIEALERHGIHPCGFAAPHGRFNRGLLAVLESLGVTHSSDFALAYDDLPFWPSGSRVLEIPIHPICLGLFVEAAERRSPGDRAVRERGVAATAEHFRRIARLKHDSGEPIFLYGHPTGRLGRYPEVLKAAFDSVATLGAVWHVSYRQFAEWWRTRHALRYSVVEQDDRLRVVFEELPRTHRVAAEFCRGSHVARFSLEGLQTDFSPHALAFEGRRRSPRATVMRVDRPHGLKRRLIELLDWERVTPVEELRGDTLRRRVKRWLRQIRD
ncbi:MAG: polysaccharide deacetylase family protein [Pirellulales bacterium]|nr:polysaccharide deacetylase family protein [Pirellulales bacterium]